MVRAIVVAQPSSTASGPMTAHPHRIAITAASIHHSRLRRRRGRRRRPLSSSSSAAAAHSSCTATSTAFAVVGVVPNGPPITAVTDSPSVLVGSRSVRSSNTSGTGCSPRWMTCPSTCTTESPDGPASTVTRQSAGAGGTVIVSDSSPVRSRTLPGLPVTVSPPSPVLRTVTGPVCAAAARNTGHGSEAVRFSGR
nr:hypothetical protein [Mycolicibacterium sp. 018/SC-01/001]